MNEPKLRFKNDNGKQFPDWEEKRVADVANRVKVGFVGACERYYTDKNGIPLYRTGNLQLGKLIEDDMKYVSKEFHIANKKSQLHKGDILVARHGSSGNAVLYNSEKEANCLNIVIIQPNLKTVNPKFMVESINSPNVVKQVSRLKNGSTQVVLNTKDIENLDVNIPSLSEQQKIALLFSELDTLIESAEKELDGYRELKKGMLQKMFPKRNEVTPEIRFLEFDGNWEQCKLGDIGKTYTSLSGKTADDFGHGEANFITYMNVYSNSIADPTMVAPIEIDAKQHEVEVGDVFFTTSSETPDEVGMSCVLKEKQGIVYLNSFCFGFRPTKSFDLNFLAYMLRSNYVRNQIKILAQGVSRYNISKTKMMDVSIIFPDYEEQKKIGEYFQNLDNLIASQQQELDGYKELKKGLLQQMFC